jgi:hypothetical protein
MLAARQSREAQQHEEELVVVEPAPSLSAM